MELRLFGAGPAIDSFLLKPAVRRGTLSDYSHVPIQF
jgi:hypothetical protein